MKKLLTTLLLLGAVAGVQAQVTVTAFNEEKMTVTINYDRSQGLATEKMVEDAIKLAFEGDEGKGIAPTMVETKMTKDQIKAAVSTIKLTGDWDNKDSQKDGGKTIIKIVEEFSKDDANRDTLDLRACQKFMSRFESVEDLLINNNKVLASNETSPGYESDMFKVTFTATTKLPDEVSTMTLTKETTVGEIKMNNRPIDKNRFTDGDYDDFIANVSSSTPSEKSYNYNWERNPGEQLNGTIKYYNQGDKFNDYNIVQVDGWYWLSEDTYTSQKLDITYIDKYFCDGKEVKGVDPNNLVQNNDGSYTYTQTITHEDTPFGINKDYDLGGIIFPESENFTYIPDESFQNSSHLTKAVIPEGIEAIGTSAFENVPLSEAILPSTITEIGGLAF